ncbi:RNA pseudouridine synthase [Mammaliicoccus lentus]|uniref:RNA pseudouridylate synthase n=1 Tax=Mammaliicoccus lentus TaxID=42858 RepID=A0AAX3W422_MAMLE|nr:MULTISPECIES: RluA family pseudouridine synthase [Mammaliicoccus]HBV03607.1 RluA family pseudouridine synthase [Staphylococcus sp.]MBF0794849.1 RluA family pseudouridine synthase [Mammaliicoccus lentus]MBW0763257.1 RluA family pseudouridine synthase [Mammaliicoccus lentus]MBW0767597.1 RluA family pseudouridine synthase [Mammaliicoccus lentus]MCR1873208.1 RluA family pseudouridine synthase [Mammaliicoccus lentus]
MHINVLYEDNHLLIVEKPVNIAVQEDASKDMDLLNMLKSYIKEKYNKPGDVYLGLVHRLDRPVGGVMVFARTSKAASRLSNELRKQQIYRKYKAIIRGTLPNKQGELVDYLYKDRKKNLVSVVSSKNKDGKKAILEYKVLSKKDNLSMLEVELKTGRSHQIRVQLANQGTPLYGDQKYGEHVNKHGQQIALWASSLSVKHPTKDEMITVESEPPKEYPWAEFTHTSV